MKIKLQNLIQVISSATVYQSSKWVYANVYFFFRESFCNYFFIIMIYRVLSLHWIQDRRGGSLGFLPEGNKSQHATSRAQIAVIRSSIILAWTYFETLGGETHTQKKIHYLSKGLSNIIMEGRWSECPIWYRKMSQKN